MSQRHDAGEVGGSHGIGRRRHGGRSRGAGINRIRRRSQPLARHQRGERAVAVCAHVHLQPAGRARELAAKIQGHGEEAVADGRGRIGQQGTKLRVARGGIVKGKAQIVTPAGRICAIVQSALIGEGRALGKAVSVSLKEEQRHERCT